MRIVRYLRVGPEGGPHDSAITLTAIGLAHGATLVLRWDFFTTGPALLGKHAALFVSGARKDRCIADFRDWFDVPTS